MHIASYGRLMAVLAALLVLTGVTVAASYVDLGPLNVWVALMIASTKASLVLLFFMHIGVEGRLVVASFLSTVFFLAIMIGFTFWDVAFRGQ
ncbi:cytochrome C oxidase subunit IV family protein [Desulfoluna spongiiphila]|uniref:Cytochrome c oxidase subunit 4 n=1 Tax=Desulfoluna spongiiphila TaxID=419481 RepID=A0A1G5H3W5_9BACT|nr:cytochrome C oxidase subunit IV family protein [Desulfoluna spongiiphila]SCY58040.1 cytochrome c oxidase subunit 4 [Desulfoluna spongiiphila]VVS94750.1 caa(3)-type oxidase subunit iv [Desulfoluna spongiiphila]